MSTQCKKFHFYLDKFVAVHFEFFFNSNYISDGNFLIILTRSMNLCCYRNLTSGRSPRVGLLNSYKDEC
jgi:hypothetical protein